MFGILSTCLHMYFHLTEHWAYYNDRKCAIHIYIIIVIVIVIQPKDFRQSKKVFINQSRSFHCPHTNQFLQTSVVRPSAALPWKCQAWRDRWHSRWVSIKDQSLTISDACGHYLLFDGLPVWGSKVLQVRSSIGSMQLWHGRWWTDCTPSAQLYRRETVRPLVPYTQWRESQIKNISISANDADRYKKYFC